MKKWAIAAAAVLHLATGAHAQSVMDHSPNLHGVWGLDSGAAFVLSHRFEAESGGDQLFNVPTLTLAAAVPLGMTLGLDYTSFSEVIPGRVTGNEAQFWLKRPFRAGTMTDLALIGAYNHAARSADGALDVRLTVGRLQLFGEGRVFSSLFGSDSIGAAAGIGAGLRLTEHLSLTGDVGRVLTADTFPTAWSAAIAVEIPASPHTFSIQIANSGATTLQGASREKTVGQSSIRWGFAFTVPFGSASRWARILRPVSEVAPPADPGATVVQLRQLAFSPSEITIRQGQTVEWVNLDPVVHTVTATDGSWDSGGLAEGGRFTRTFAEPGTYTYFCVPHPMMRGTITVLP